MRILYVTTTFPVYSETFIQREARALRRAGAELSIVSLHGGEAEWEGEPVTRFRKLELLTLLWRLPAEGWRNGERMLEVARSLNTAPPRGWLNVWENLLGLGAAVVMARQIRLQRHALVHGVWAGGPAAFGLALQAMTGIPFSMGAHAYDVFENGGDWLLADKARGAALIQCSTEAAARRMRVLAEPKRVAAIRRGLDRLPACKPLRADRSSLRLLCIARLVAKKGLPLQLEIYRRLAAAGVEFEARIAGDGPLEPQLRRLIEASGLSGRVRLLGRLTEDQIAEQLQWADALLHTGVVAPNGDRDGLPNAIPEAMAAGVIVLASPMAGVREAVMPGRTGLLIDPRAPEEWVSALRRFAAGGSDWDELRAGARQWTEAHFRADANAQELMRRMRSAANAALSAIRT